MQTDIDLNKLKREIMHMRSLNEQRKLITTSLNAEIKKMSVSYKISSRLVRKLLSNNDLFEQKQEEDIWLPLIQSIL